MICKRCRRDYPSEYYFKAPGICGECFDAMTPEEREALQRPSGLHRMTTTAFTIDGYEVVESLGVVRGITVRSRSIFGTIGASLQTLVGGNITLFSDLCERTRAEAFDMMLSHAVDMGANAVIGIRYDATEVMDTVSEVLCYGTAVIVRPLNPSVKS
jgi:uncharacterized protein YbjQ (UPF0145 family)